MISIVSIPHTGTQFTQKLLVDMGYEVRCCHAHADHPLQNPQLWIDEGGKVVIPWRDPELVRISAVNRNETPRPVSEFEQLLAWSNLDHVHLFEVEPGEIEAKDSELAALQEFLESETAPVTDWEPVNASDDVTGLKARYIEDTRPVVPIESLAPDPMEAAGVA